MRLIDADALRKYLPVDKYGHIKTTITKLNIALEKCVVDAVHVVRCKDCKYAHLTYDGDCKYCDIMTENADGESFPLYLPSDWYCADGERREVTE